MDRSRRWRRRVNVWVGSWVVQILLLVQLFWMKEEEEAEGEWVAEAPVASGVRRSSVCRSGPPSLTAVLSSVGSGCPYTPAALPSLSHGPPQRKVFVN